MTRGDTVTSPAGVGVIDLVVTHPDGLKFFRVNDHWFAAQYLNT